MKQINITKKVWKDIKQIKYITEQKTFNKTVELLCGAFWEYNELLKNKEKNE